LPSPKANSNRSLSPNFQKPIKLRKKETDFIKAQSVGRIATVSGEGIPHNVPVCPILDGGNVYIGSDKEARKVKNMQVNPSATIVFDIYHDSWKALRGVMLQCRARIVDKKEFKRIRKKLYVKYLHYESQATLEFDDSVIIELTPEKTFSWGFE
jgi:nitroimidazol reductase NimA-like FMN-containing flavoprotein (pyridoxamine 5'-phosphate oxidase superfamily)